LDEKEKGIICFHSGQHDKRSGMVEWLPQLKAIVALIKLCDFTMDLNV
jgi:hypothetical protein